VLFAILLFFAVRLLVKCCWRLMFLAILLPIGMLACAAYAAPAPRWILAGGRDCGAGPTPTS
jgi:hypothetical protein